jgi:Tfp pilus assembly protein PilN
VASSFDPKLLLERLKTSPMLRGFLPQPFLVISLEEYTVRGLVVEPGQNLRIRSFSEAVFDLSGRNARVKIAKLLESLDATDIRDVVVITPEVQCSPVWLSEPPRKRLSNPRQALLSALRTEVAPYLEAPPPSYLLAMQWAGQVEDSVAEDESPSPRRAALAFAMPRTAWNALATALKGFRKHLVAALAPEVVAWSMCPRTVGCSGTRVLVDWKLQEAVGALVHEGKPVQTHVQPREAGEEPGQVLLHTIAQVAHESIVLNEVIVGGEVAETTSLGAMEPGSEGVVLKKWDVSQEFPQMKAPEGVPARYMSLVAAAVNHSLPPSHRAGCNGNATFLEQMRANINVLPAAVFLLIAMLLGADLLHLKHRKSRIETATTRLQSQLDQLQAKVDEKESLEKKQQGLALKKREYEANQELLRTTLPAATWELHGLLEGLVAKTPGDVQLLTLDQMADRNYVVTGRARNPQTVQGMATRLQEISGVTAADLMTTSEREIPGSGGSRPERRYEFSFRIRTAEEAP